MHCLVTAGATTEPIDEVRLLTNRSTGRLGSMLADSLCQENCKVSLLLSKSAQYHPKCDNVEVHSFTTGESLKKKIIDKSKADIAAVFHVAAVSDFEPIEIRKGKIDSMTPFTLRLNPTPKIIKDLRCLYPDSLLIGWKYETEGNPESIRAKGQEQIDQCRTDGCVLNGPAYGDGYGLLQESVDHCGNEYELFERLITLLQ